MPKICSLLMSSAWLVCVLNSGTAISADVSLVGSGFNKNSQNLRDPNGVNTRSDASLHKKDVEMDGKSLVWDSPPMETFETKIQILDKISEKVLRSTIKVGSQITFGGLVITLKRCFKSSPEDKKEIWAFITISENEKMIFSGWLVASSQSINLFSHQVYDVRIEF